MWVVEFSVSLEHVKKGGDRCRMQDQPFAYTAFVLTGEAAVTLTVSPFPLGFKVFLSYFSIKSLNFVLPESLLLSYSQLQNVLDIIVLEAHFYLFKFDSETMNQTWIKI